MSKLFNHIQNVAKSSYLGDWWLPWIPGCGWGSLSRFQMEKCVPWGEIRSIFTLARVIFQRIMIRIG